MSLLLVLVAVAAAAGLFSGVVLADVGLAASSAGTLFLLMVAAAFRPRERLHRCRSCGARTPAPEVCLACWRPRDAVRPGFKVDRCTRRGWEVREAGNHWSDESASVLVDVDGPCVTVSGSGRVRDEVPESVVHLPHGEEAQALRLGRLIATVWARHLGDCVGVEDNARPPRVREAGGSYVAEGSSMPEPGGRFHVDGPAVAARLAREHIGSDIDRREHMVCLYLSTKNDLLGEPYTVSIGSLSASVVHPREVLRPAVERSAAAFVMVHNHPSGRPEPSPEDVEFSVRMVQAGNLLGIRCLDHVVLGDGSFQSLGEAGHIPAVTVRERPEAQRARLDARSDLHLVSGRVLQLSHAGRARFDRLPVGPSEETATVWDRASGQWWEVKRASCGLACFCAAQGEPLVLHLEAVRERLATDCRCGCEGERRFSLGVYAGTWCDECWKQSGYRDEPASAFDPLDAGETYDDGEPFDYGDGPEVWERSGDYDPEEWADLCDTFQDPGGRSALRRAHRGNPRNLPCPTCGRKNALTPADRARGYQCDRCADADEGMCYERPDEYQGRAFLVLGGQLFGVDREQAAGMFRLLADPELTDREVGEQLADFLRVEGLPLGRVHALDGLDAPRAAALSDLFAQRSLPFGASEARERAESMRDTERACRWRLDDDCPACRKEAADAVEAGRWAGGPHVAIRTRSGVVTPAAAPSGWVVDDELPGRAWPVDASGEQVSLWVSGHDLHLYALRVESVEVDPEAWPIQRAWDGTLQDELDALEALAPESQSMQAGPLFSWDGSQLDGDWVVVADPFRNG